MINQELLKVYSAYLPYGVKYIYKDSKEIKTMRTISTEINLIDLGWGNAHDFTEFKPILRPLSDLTKEIEHNGEKFVPLDYLYSKSYPIDYFEYKYHHDYFFSWIESKDKSHHVKFLPHGLIKQLQEWHFDVFGLLNKNLAINLNEVK